ncbi:Rv3235 family protein [Zhihengliuella flava]|uniref:3-hydroxyacyl-CoA dehydrogenase n=1 Tax=Zhihengliuella flava TaxID=1285193 RepID=A0A931DAT0_9MICC|nr:hypothetical protein [Zhihengliuella flava]
MRRFADLLPAPPTPSAWGTPQPEDAPTAAAPLRDATKTTRPSATPDGETLREHQELSRLARVVAQSAFEVLTGGRTATQMRRWLDGPVLERLRERSELAMREVATQRMNRTITVRRSRICRITNDIFEASVAVQCHDRHRAAALRLERRRGQWKVSALELG